MKKAISLILLPAIISLNGCAGASWSVSGSCSSRDGCEVSGEINGTFAHGGRNIPLIDRFISSQHVVDAAELELDISGSNINVANSGLVTITLVDASNGITQAARAFPWVKHGSKLILSNPDDVNAWALAEGGTATTLKYEIHPFPVQSNPGENVFQVSAQYQGSTQATSTTSWSGGREDHCEWPMACEPH